MIKDSQWPRASAWLAADHDAPTVAVVGVPYSKASLTPSGADLAPLEMRRRLDRFSTYHGESRVDLSKVSVRDLGNWPVTELGPAEMIPVVEDLARELNRFDLKLFLGGDNSITRPLCSAEAEDLEEVGLITFDAHHDVRTLSSGPSNGTPVRGLIEEHGLPGTNVVQIGIHSFANSEPYRSYCEDQGITTVSVDQVDKIGILAAVDVALSQLAALCDRIYVDVDIDVLDRAFAPGCPGARPGGLTVRQLSAAVSRCATHPSVKAMDFVEVDPGIDIAGMTLDVMAHLFLSAMTGFALRASR